MKIKTLAIAAATLAVGAISSQAQVYSQNVVGYVNVTYPANTLIFAANPLTTGNDVLTNVLKGVPGASHLYYWSGSTWVTYQYSAGSRHWLNGAVDVSNTNIPPGVGFFLSAASAFTNTYSGTIACNTGGGQATNAIANTYAPVGAIVPYADVVTNTSTFNLVVAGASQLQKWDPIAQQFEPVFQYSAGSRVWKQGTTSTNPVIGVAEGFFISPAISTNWVQTLQ